MAHLYDSSLFCSGAPPVSGAAAFYLRDTAARRNDMTVGVASFTVDGRREQSGRILVPTTGATQVEWTIEYYKPNNLSFAPSLWRRTGTAIIYPGDVWLVTRDGVSNPNADACLRCPKNYTFNSLTRMCDPAPIEPIRVRRFDDDPCWEDQVAVKGTSVAGTEDPLARPSFRYIWE